MEKNTIIQWLNTLTKSHKISNLHELKDGKHFLEFARTINPVKKLTSEREGSVDARYEFVKETLEDYFHFKCEKSVDLQGCIKGKDKELVRLSCLLLSAVVNHCLPDEHFLSPLSQLDIKIQEQIRDCLQLILLSDNEDLLRSNILSINSIEETPRTQYTRLRSSLEGAAASPALKKKPGRKRAVPVESPIKLFMDSPTLKHQAILRKKSKEISELQHQLNVEENKALELENQNVAIQAELQKKEKEIMELKENIKTLRPYRDLAEESHEDKLVLEEKLEKLKNIYEHCPSCKDWGERYKNLEKELNEEKESNYNKDEKMSDLNQHLEKSVADIMKKDSEIVSLKENVRELEHKIRALATKEENMNFEITIYKKKYEEIVNSERSPSTPKRSPGESVKGIVDIELQKQEEKNQELEKKIEQLVIANESLQKELTDVRKGKISKEKKHLEEVNHLTTRYGVVVENLEKLELENSALKNQLLNKEIDEEKHKQLTEKILEYEKSIGEYILQNQNLEKEIAQSTTRFSMIEKEVGELNAEVLQLREKNFSLSERLEKYNDQLLEQQNKCTVLSQENLQLQCEVQKVIEEKENKGKQIIELQKQIDCLQLQISSSESEIQQANANNRFLVGEIDRIKQTKQIAEAKLKQQKKEENSFLKEKEKLRTKIQSQSKVIKDLQDKNTNLTSELNKQSSASYQKDIELKRKNEDYENLLVKCQLQNKKLLTFTEINKALALKLENEERKYAEMKNECEYTGKVKNKEISELKQSTVKFSREVNDLGSCNDEGSTVNKNIRTTASCAISGHVSELDQLGKELQSSVDEGDSLKQKNEALTAALKLNNEELIKINAEATELHEKLTAAENSLRAAESVIKAHEATLQNLQNAHNKHFAICSGQCDDIEKERADFQELERERNRLINKIEELESTLSSVIEKKNNLEKEREELQKLKILHSMHLSVCSGNCNDFEMEKKSTIRSLEVEKAMLLEQISKITDEVNIKEQQLETKNKIISEASVALEQKESELKELHRTVETNQKLSEELNILYQQLQQKAVKLEEFQKSTLKKNEEDHNIEKEKKKYECSLRSLSECLENTRTENRDMQKKIQDFTLRVEEYSKEMENINSENEMLKSELKELRNMYEDNVKKLEEIHTENAEITAALNLSEEKLRLAVSNAEKLRVENHNIQKEKEKCENSLNSLSNSVENMQNELAVYQTENHDMRKKVQDLTSEVEECNKKMEYVNRKNELLTSEVQELRIVYEDNIRKIEEMDSENKEIRANLSHNEEELQKTIADVDKWRIEFEQLQTSHVKHFAVCTDCANSELAKSTDLPSLRATVHLRFRDKEWYDKRFIFDNKLLEIIDERNKSIQRLEDHIQKLETEKGEIPVEQHPKYEKLLKQNENLCSQKEVLETEAQETRKHLRDVNTEMKALAEKLKKLERTSQCNETRLSAKYEKAKEVIEKIRNENSEYECKLKDALGQLKLLEQQVFTEEKYEEALKQSKDEYSALKADLEDMQQNVDPLRFRINVLENDLKAANEKLILVEDQYKLARNEIKKLRKSTEKRTGPNTPSFLAPFLTPKRRKQQNGKEGSEKKKKKGPVTFNNVFYKMDVDEAVYYSVPVTPGVTMSLTGSTSKSVNNKSHLGGASHFKCEDEEDFLNHSSLLSSKKTYTPPSVKKSSTERQMELSRRNTLCLPHLRSTYPVELQIETPPPLRYPATNKMAKSGKGKHKHDIPDFELDKPVKGVFYKEFGDMYKMVPSNRYKIHSEDYPVTVKEYNEIQRKIDAIDWRPFPLKMFDKCKKPE